MEYPREILHNNVLLKLVGVHPETGNAFYINDGHGGVIGVKVYPNGSEVVVNANYMKPAPRAKHGRKDSYLQFRHAWGFNKQISASHAVYIAWVGPIKPGMSIDHINGSIQDNRFENLRQIDLRTNIRDGGFLRKLRNKGIDPTRIQRPYLLRYFRRMAKIKVEITEYRYKHLSKEQLKHLLYDN